MAKLLTQHGARRRITMLEKKIGAAGFEIRGLHKQLEGQEAALHVARADVTRYAGYADTRAQERDDFSRRLTAANETIAKLGAEIEEKTRKLLVERTDHMATINERDAARERAGLAEQRVVYLEGVIEECREGLNRNQIVQAARAADVALASRSDAEKPARGPTEIVREILAVVSGQKAAG